MYVVKSMRQHGADSMTVSCSLSAAPLAVDAAPQLAAHASHCGALLPLSTESVRSSWSGHLERKYPQLLSHSAPVCLKLILMLALP